jgi:hypothetical protein
VARVERAKAEALAYLEAKAAATARATARANTGVSPLRFASVEMARFFAEGEEVGGSFGWACLGWRRNVAQRWSRILIQELT